MNILNENNVKTIHACRFCFMCRHLSPIGNVTFRESDTPRGRALMLDKVHHRRQLLTNPDYIQSIYDADLSAACHYHCVSHFDEAGLVLAARRDMVEAGAVPPSVRKLSDELKKNHPKVHGSQSPEIVYFVDPYSSKHELPIPQIVSSILDATGGAYSIISDGDSGKMLNVLGYYDEARIVANRLASSVIQTGAKILITSCPAAYDAFKNDYSSMGIPLADRVEVLHTSEWLLRLFEQGKLTGGSSDKQSVYWLHSDYLKNYNAMHTPEKLLNTLGFKLLTFGTNSEESYTGGEGAMVLDQINPGLVAKLVDRIIGLMDHPESDVLVAASPYTRYALAKWSGGKINIKTVEELVFAYMNKESHVTGHAV